MRAKSILLCLAVAAPLTLMTAGAGAPDGSSDFRGLLGKARMDLSDAQRGEIQLPEGHALRIATADGQPLVEVVPLEASMSHGVSADCLDAIPFSIFWVPATALGIPNVAPACFYDVHTVPITLGLFVTAGDGFGAADALDHPTGSYFYIECAGPASVAVIDGAGNVSWIGSCFWYWYGVPPGAYTYWDSLVGNFHGVGATYIRWS